MSILLKGVGRIVTVAPGPLDSGAPGFAAFSMSRALGAIAADVPKFRVRRSTGAGDDLEVDITGNTSAEIEAQILAHCTGVNSGYVTKVYDQTGNGRHRHAPTLFGIQPRVCNAGAVDKVNGFVVARFLNGDHVLKAITPWLTRDTAYNWNMVYKHPASTSLLFVVGTNEYSFVAQNGDGSSAHNRINTEGVSYKNGVSVADTSRDNIYDSFNTDALLSHAIEGWNPDDFWGDTHNIGGYNQFSAGFDWTGYYAEEIIYQDSVQSNAEFLAVIAEQMTHYSL